MAAVTLRMIDTFSGIGGFSLAARWLGGFETVQFVEREPFCQRILRKHWPDVPIHDDICTFNPAPGTADVVVGGFPCQDISQAGKGAGLSGDRSGLFYELIRVVRLVRPRYIVLENVAAILTRGLDDVLGTLAEAGYDTEWACIPAAAVGACHRRDRWWCVAYRAGWDAWPAHTSGQCGERWGTASDVAGAPGTGEADREQRERDGDAPDDRRAVAADTQGGRRRTGKGQRTGKVGHQGEGTGDSVARSDAADPAHLQRHGGTGEQHGQHPPALAARAGQPAWPDAPLRLNPDWRAYVSEPVLCRGDARLSARVDRLKALGNAVVPQVAMIPLARVLQLEALP